MSDYFMASRACLSSYLPRRIERSNKGTYGHALLFAGSRGMAGAALLGAEAAYRCGCGLTAVCGPEENRVILQSMLPEALYKDRKDLPRMAAWGSALGAGPGIGTGYEELMLLRECLSAFSGPIILDADALTLFAAHEDLWEKVPEQKTVITPHPGEMSRLTGMGIAEILADPRNCAEQFAGSHHVICVLKDHRTVVTDGRRTCINDFGCDGMAAGGSGDVLTGILTSLAAQVPGQDLFHTACLGVCLHAKAGEYAQAEIGARSMLARDIIRHLPDVFKEFGG